MCNIKQGCSHEQKVFTSMAFQLGSVISFIFWPFNWDQSYLLFSGLSTGISQSETKVEQSTTLTGYNPYADKF